jgi:hypothetical protein
MYPYHVDPHDAQFTGDYHWDDPLSWPLQPHDEPYINIGAGLYRDIAHGDD